MAGPRAMNGLDEAQVGSLSAALDRLRHAAAAGVERVDSELKGEDAELFREGLTGDAALAEAEFERDVAGAGQVRTALLAIVAAQRRLATGDYGLCEDCGERIGYPRLEAQPAASRCVRCQEVAERGTGPALFPG